MLNNELAKIIAYKILQLGESHKKLRGDPYGSQYLRDTSMIEGYIYAFDDLLKILKEGKDFEGNGEFRFNIRSK